MKIAPLLATSAVLFAIPALRAQAQATDKATHSTIPDSERAQLARRWFKAYNGGAERAYRKFMETYADTDGDTPVAARVERFGQMRKNLGDLTLLGAKETPEGIELKVRTEKGAEGTVTVMITSKAPFRFQAVRVEI